MRNKYIIGLILAASIFIMAILVFSWFEGYKTPASSMAPTLEIGDNFLLNRFAYGINIQFSGNLSLNFRKPQRGDVIVFEFPDDRSKHFVSRVIGVGGDTVEIRNKDVFVNGQQFTVKQAVFKSGTIMPKGISPRDNLESVTIPENHLFVLGDNRDSSFDSRFWGILPLKLVRGKALLTYYNKTKGENEIRFIH